MKKPTGSKGSRSSRKSMADLRPRNARGAAKVKGGLTSSVLKKRDDTANAVIGKI